MSQIPQPKPVTPLGVWANAVTQQVKGNVLAQNKSGLRQQVSGQGSFLSPKLLAGLNPLFLALPTRYDYESEYAKGDLVFMTEADIPAGIAHNFYPGIWLCVQTVPSNHYQTIGGMEDYRRKTGKNYYPTWPLPDDEDMYWLLISLYPVRISVCENNRSKSYYIAGSEISGSAG